MPSLQRVGVMLETVQLSDISCVDLLGWLSSEIIKAASEFVPPDIRPLATDMTFYYISSDLEPTTLTPSIKVIPTCTYDTAPRDLDILLIGGPLLSHRPPAADKFMKEAAKETKVIMTTCIGSAWLASSGVLNGKKATTNRGALDMVKQMYPEVDWQDERWTIDGKFWTSGGAAAGVDMVATYIKEHFAKPIADFALVMLDVDPTVRGRYYAA
jgi:transcriptional regulator GlxA family with amidase domain